MKPFLWDIIIDRVHLPKVRGSVSNIDDIDENLTLDEVKFVNDKIAEEIQLDISPVILTADELRYTTVASLKSLYSNYKMKTIDHDAGLKAFYNHVVKNEADAIDSIISMETQFMHYEADGYIDRRNNNLMIIPGFVGNHNLFRSIAERLKIQAATLQLGPDVINKSIPEIAQSLTNLMKFHFELPSKFYILGYSFGVNVALEIAKLLEAEGKSGVVYCLDSSPDALKSQLKAYIGYCTDVQLQNAILMHMYQLMTGQESEKLKQELENSESWSQKVEICLNSLQGLVNWSIEHRQTILESAYERILLARDYEPDVKLKSKIVLIKGIPHPKSENLTEDYNLSKYTTQPVKIFQIESDHASAPYDCRVPNIVNRMLDPNLLEDFKKKNLCEYYYL